MNQDSIEVPVLHLISMNRSSFNLEYALPLLFFLSMTFTFRKDQARCLTGCPTSTFVQLFPHGTG